MNQNTNSGQMVRPSSYQNTMQQSSSSITSTTNSQQNNQGISQNISNNAEVNTALICKVGSETVQEIASRAIEIFKELKSIQLPNGSHNATQIALEKKKKILDNFGLIRQLFRKLKVIYDKVNSDCNGMDYTPIETLISYKGDVENRVEVKKVSENYRHLIDEGRELREQLSLRSSYLKEIIYQLRKTIWEINTMLHMRSRWSEDLGRNG